MISNKTVKVCLVAVLVTILFLSSVNIGIAFDPPLDGDEAPITTISFDKKTGIVTLVAQDMPLYGNCGVKATYYDIGNGQQTYTAPFKLPEGEVAITYWSIDNCDNEESQKTAIYTVDTIPPTVEIITPEQGKLYIFGSPLMDRVYNDITLCIGKVPIEVEADDGEGMGISMVLFNIENDTGFEIDPPYTYTFRNKFFGELTISVRAIDNNEWISEPATMKVIVYSLGLL